MLRDADFLFRLAANVLTALGVLLVAWALIGDAVLRYRCGLRRRPRCPRCWYDMSGTAGPACPECGHSAKNHRQLCRTRCRWSWAFAAIALFLVATQVREFPLRRSEAGKWTRFVPTTALLFVADHKRVNPADPATAALIERQFRVTAWQRYIGATVEARRISAAEFGGVVVTRQVWPAGSNIRLYASSTSSMEPVVGYRQLRVTPRAGGPVFGLDLAPPIPPTVCVMRSPSIANLLELGVLPPGEYKRHFDVAYCDEWRELRRGQAACAFRVAKPGEQVLAPVSALDNGNPIRAALRITREYPASAYPGRPSIWFSLDQQAIWTNLYAGKPAPGLALGGSLTVLDGARELAVATLTGDAFDVGGFWGDMSELEELVLVPVGETGRFQWDREAIARITIIVRADESAAAQIISASKYWDFTVRIPLSEVIAQTPP